MREWLRNRVALPLLACAAVLSFRTLMHRGNRTFQGWGWLFAFALDYGIWLAWEAINRVESRAGKAFGWCMFAATIATSVSFQAHGRDYASYVPPALLAVGVIAERLLRRRSVTEPVPEPVSEPAHSVEREETSDAPSPVEPVDLAAHAWPPPSTPTVVDEPPAPEPQPEPQPEPEPAARRQDESDAVARPASVRPRGRAVPTDRDREVVAAALADSTIAGTFVQRRAAVVDLTASADPSGTGLTMLSATALLRETIAAAAESNGKVAEHV
jgi:outer membrane biosynthesis protein TonB